MPRAKKDNVPISIRMDKTIAEKLNQFCKESGQSKTVAIERAVEMYVDDYYQKMKKIQN